MDAYNIANRMKEFWSVYSDKHSGLIIKETEKMPVEIEFGFNIFEVTGIRFDEESRSIKLDIKLKALDNEETKIKTN